MGVRRVATAAALCVLAASGALAQKATGGDPAPAPGPINTLGVRTYTITDPDAAGGLQPGESVGLRLQHIGSNDTCTQDLYLVAAELVYD